MLPSSRPMLVGAARTGPMQAAAPADRFEDNEIQFGGDFTG